jgi:formate hydrogenlyase transcriptional activator
VRLWEQSVGAYEVSDRPASDKTDYRFGQIVGKSRALEAVLEQVERVGPTNAAVLLLGETGTGKELIAQAIHNTSSRCSRRFVKVNCAAIPLDLLESELFGHEKGAFTGAITQSPGRFELAHQGTLFLDEVGDIPLGLQPKLLRVLQDHEFERLGSGQTHKADVRVIAATHRNLTHLVASNEFRIDLYYRLNVFPILIPPLRERREDIPLLVSHFVEKYSRQMQKRIDKVPETTLKELVRWSWPGNIRELENFIARAVILSRDGILDAPVHQLREPFATPLSSAGYVAHGDVARIVKETLEVVKLTRPKRGPQVEALEKQRQEIMQVLRETNGRVGGADGAAARMRINRTTLISRMNKLGIRANDLV